MNKDCYQKLTLAIYKVTEFFPQKEPLRFQIREVANKILANLILSGSQSENIDNKGEVLRDIKILYSYFELADAQNWVDSRNFSVLKREYDKVRELIESTPIFNEFTQSISMKPLLLNTGKVGENPLSGNGSNNYRQEKILEAMNGNGMVKIGDLIKMFPGINRRTVLRDLDKLCQAGIAVKNGNGRGAHYVKNGHNNSSASV